VAERDKAPVLRWILSHDLVQL